MTCVLERKGFNDAMQSLKRFEDDLDVADKAMQKLSPDFGGFYLTRPIEIIHKLLIAAMGGDEEGWIGYFMYELDWGATWKEGTITNKDGTDIKLATIEDLYEILIQSKAKP